MQPSPTPGLTIQGSISDLMDDWKRMKGMLESLRQGLKAQLEGKQPLPGRPAQEALAWGVTVVLNMNKCVEVKRTITEDKS